MSYLKEILEGMKNLGWWHPKMISYLEQEDYTLEEAVDFVQERLNNKEEDLASGYYFSLLIDAKISENDKIVLRTNKKEYRGYRYP